MEAACRSQQCDAAGVWIVRDLTTRVMHGLLLLAILTAIVGVHVIHPALHGDSSHDGCQSETNPACSGSYTDGPARPARVARDADRTWRGECPVCIFLKSFHSRDVGARPVSVLLGTATEATPRADTPTPQSPCWYVASARAPPSVLPSS